MLKALKGWEQAFLQALEEQPGEIGLLFDSHRHDFESVECLQWLRAFFTTEARIRSQVNRVAFVRPAQYRVPEIVSDEEAYFVHVADARSWLRQGRRNTGF